MLGLEGGSGATPFCPPTGSCGFPETPPSTVAGFWPELLDLSDFFPLRLFLFFFFDSLLSNFLLFGEGAGGDCGAGAGDGFCCGTDGEPMAVVRGDCGELGGGGVASSVSLAIIVERSCVRSVSNCLTAVIQWRASAKKSCNIHWGFS